MSSLLPTDPTERRKLIRALVYMSYNTSDTGDLITTLDAFWDQHHCQQKPCPFSYDKIFPIGYKGDPKSFFNYILNEGYPLKEKEKKSTKKESEDKNKEVKCPKEKEEGEDKKCHRRREIGRF